MIARARFCLSCGRRLRTVDGEGRRHRRCPACGWTFYGNAVPAAAGIIIRGGRVLLTRRAHPPYAGTWDLPGGFLDGAETPEAGMRRELKEELGIEVRDVKVLGFLMDRYGLGGLPILNVVFRVTPEPGPIRPADDVSEARWFPLDAVPFRAIGFPAMRQAVRDYARSRAARARRRDAPAP